MLVTTPTGTIGSRVLRRLTEQPSSSLSIRVIARKPQKLSEKVRASLAVEIVKGCHDDSETLLNALNGVDAVFWCQPDSITADHVHEFYGKFAAVGRDAFKLCKTPRVVAISAAGGEFAEHAGPISALREAENILRASGTALRFLRCGSFYENLLWQLNSLRDDGSFFYSIAGRAKHPMVACDDVARVAVQWLLDATWSGTGAINLLGPADLSYDDVADVLGEVLQRRVEYAPVSHHEYREMLLSLGYHENAAAALQDMFDVIEASDWQALRRDPKSSGKTTLHDWAKKYLQPLFFCPALGAGSTAVG